MDTQQAAAVAGSARPWVVYDVNASGDVPRVHQIITKTFDDGREPLVKNFKLYADKDPEPQMTMQEALKFLTDPKFIVQDPQGKRVTPPPKVEGGTGGYQLPDHQTIANWDELSGAALYKRCQIIPGGERIKPDDGREVMVAFLTSWRKAQSGGVDAIAETLNGQISGSDTLDSAADARTLNGMFGEESPLIAGLRAQGSASVA